MKGSSFFFLLFSLTAFTASAQKIYRVSSPDNRLQTEISVGEEVKFSLSDDTQQILAPSTVAMTLAGGETLGENARVRSAKYTSGDETIPSPFYKRTSVQDRYNQLTISFKGYYALVFRMYDDGMAYRFVTSRKGEQLIEKEVADYRMAKDFKAHVTYVRNNKPTFEQQFFNSFENHYDTLRVSQLNPKRLIFLPMLFELDNGARLCITEVDMEEFPGLFLNGSGENPALSAVHAPYPKKIEQGGHNMLQGLVKERENYIAKTSGTRSFPWRAFVVTKNDAGLLETDMVYRLASPARFDDTSWIKPGKVAWEWWNNWNLYDVDFRTGVNNETYKYYIDFASKYGIEYVILDEGWAVNKKADLLQVVPEIDIPALVEYGRERNVGIILWAGYYAMDRDLENVVKHYADMGVKGFKVDFMDRDDQKMVDFLYRTSKVCAEHKMLVDFHGVFKPTGLQRTYPNVVNYEGVHGLEQLKWSKPDVDMVSHDVTLPFTRMVAGPMDYTQGAMLNCIKGEYRPNNNSPMSQGTRCHQLGAYVVFESPLNMLCDSPSNYMREKESIDFIANIPTVWDDTRAIDGRVGEYVAIARRAGDEWYVGAMTNWTPRTLTLKMPVGEGDYLIEIFRDGVNADRAARDYKREVMELPADRMIQVKMAPGGGWAARIYKK